MAEKNSSKKKILLAENEAINLEFLELMLSKLGFEVFATGDGGEAINILNSEELDLVLTNTMLPKVSGWEILKTVRSNAQLQVIPVLFLSDIDNVKEKVEAYELGVEDFITKPFNFSVMLVRIRSALRKKELYEKVEQSETKLTTINKFEKEVKTSVTKLLNEIKDLKKELSSTNNEQLVVKAHLIEQSIGAFKKRLSTYLLEDE